MIFTSKQLSELVGMSRFGFQKLVKNLNIPYSIKGNKFLFNSNDTRFRDFFDSLNMANQNNELQVFYSLKDIAKLREVGKDTIRKLIIKNDIKFYMSGRKMIVLLIDLHRFQQLMYNSGN
jgi:excisionase family DNA binding protein